MTQLMRVSYKDGLATNYGCSQANYACVIYCRVPDDWVAERALRKEKLELLFQKMYGVTWRSGNEDGSSYVVFESHSEPVSAVDEQAGAWRALTNDKAAHYWFWRVEADGSITSVRPDVL
ncbi:MAG: hypothetical protein WCT04_04655 [Planctomycetota bacterium]